jgi:biopolymer transport protein ExbD
MARVRRDYSSEAEINILPVLNLFSVLVPFMMLAAVFAEVAILDLNLPTPGSGEAGEAPETPPLMLTVVVSKDGFTVGASGGFLDSIMKNPDGTYNYERLENQLSKVKENYPHEEEVIIASELATKYQTIVHVMDVARDSGFPNISLSGLHGDGT